jgi:nitroimidazol reductase NimA-like FMN-containing flavoprotein (pyridoxamine 5'-phosphate oxidase superfamily)
MSELSPTITAGETFELSAEECRELLAAGLVGRVAMCTPMGPHVVPVNYSVVDQSVIVRTTPYSVLGSHARGTILALEVDQFDYERHRGWSVVARGRADVVTRADDLEDITRHWEPRAWAAGSRNLFLRIRWSELSGRRLGAGWHPADELPVRQMH